LGGVWTWGHFQSRCSTTWVIPPVHFALVIFGDRVSWTICPGWPQTSVLLTSVSQVAGITSVSHQHLAEVWCS
jgi:hypothetical protein